MPTREYKRLWCKKCSDWRLHEQNYPNTTDWFCTKCESPHEKTLLSEIPDDKILEQRKRYSEWRKKRMDGLFGSYLLTGFNVFSDMSCRSWHDDSITESDAGQEKIDDDERKRKEEERIAREEKRYEKALEIKKYKGLSRNDICICGSGLKYKKCCLTKIRKDEQDYNL
jgi:hypothetical protein